MRVALAVQTTDLRGLSRHCRDRSLEGRRIARCGCLTGRIVCDGCVRAGECRRGARRHRGGSLRLARARRRCACRSSRRCRVRAPGRSWSRPTTARRRSPSSGSTSTPRRRDRVGDGLRRPDGRDRLRRRPRRARLGAGPRWHVPPDRQRPRDDPRPGVRFRVRGQRRREQRGRGGPLPVHGGLAHALRAQPVALGRGQHRDGFKRAERRRRRPDGRQLGVRRQPGAGSVLTALSGATAPAIVTMAANGPRTLSAQIRAENAATVRLDNAVAWPVAAPLFAALNPGAPMPAPRRASGASEHAGRDDARARRGHAAARSRRVIPAPPRPR